MLILYVVLKHILQPLQELNETTKRLAEGNYDQRVVVRRKDEIGELEESFNKMAEAVETSTRDLEESEHRKTLFMGNLTHELKTPMTAMSGYAQTLLSTKLSPENRNGSSLYLGRVRPSGTAVQKDDGASGVGPGNRVDFDGHAGGETV